MFIDYFGLTPQHHRAVVDAVVEGAFRDDNILGQDDRRADFVELGQAAEEVTSYGSVKVHGVVHQYYGLGYGTDAAFPEETHGTEERFVENWVDGFGIFVGAF